MFERIKQLLSRRIGLFPTAEIKKVFDVDIAVSEEMARKIEFWQDMYAGCAYWIDDDVISLRLEQAIVREFSNAVLTEMSTAISDKKLDNIFTNAIRNLNENLQSGFATGALIIKPLGKDCVQYIPQSQFIPIEYDSRGRLIKVVFPDVRQVGEHDFYTRLEYHCLSQKNGLTVINKAFHSMSRDTLGKMCPLSQVEDWKDILEYENYSTMFRTDFGYYRNPIANTIDNSFSGVSIFDCAADLIYKADRQFGRIEWEFESGERAIIVDDAALQLTESKKRDLPHTFKRLYKGLDISIDSNGGELFHEFSPVFRQEDLLKGLDEYKRLIEFQVGLSYGDISNPQSVEKTAQEVKAAKKRKYNTVNAIQQNLRDCLDDLCYALAFYNCMTKNYDFNCSFKDSILADEETERKQDLQDVSVGAMPLWEYRMKWYGEDEKTAKSKISDNADVID